MIRFPLRIPKNANVCEMGFFYICGTLTSQLKPHKASKQHEFEKTAQVRCPQTPAGAYTTWTL